MERDLKLLDNQLTVLTQGDLRVAKKRDGKIKFNPAKQSKSLQPKEVKTTGEDVGHDSVNEDEKFKRQLFKKCFNRKNIALGKMT